MNEGKELLLNVIDNKLLSIHSINKDELYIDNINLVELLTSIQDDSAHFSNVTDNIIERVLPNCKTKNEASFKKSIIQIRDLLIGKRDYNLQVNITPEYQKNINIFIKGLNSMLEELVPGVVNIESLEAFCINIIKAIKAREIISDFTFIESIVKEYNEIEFDNNMVIIMHFINEHNLSILKTPKKNAPIFDIQFIRKPKLDSRIKEILDKLELDYKDLPNYLLSELKRSNYEEVYQTYSLVRKNKAEDYGIWHLIKKENILAKLILILYGTPESIKNIVDSTRKENGEVDVNLLKIIINSTITVFLVKNNNYFKPKYEDFIKNIILLKDLGVNYRALITRNPIFMVLNNEILMYTLTTLESKGASKKAIINKCYKTLSVDPALLIDNMNTLINLGIDIKEFFSNQKTNYNLLKVVNLEKKLNYIINKNKLNNPYDIELLNKHLIGKIYREVMDEKIVWSEDND